MEFADIDPRLIDPHPRNAEIYGTQPLEPEFRKSIREHGVLNRITVRRKPDGRYESISGHRRTEAAVLEDLGSVPVEIRTYNTEQEVLLHLIEFNRDRVKSPRVKWLEMETLEIALSDAAKDRQLSGLTDTAPSSPASRGQREASGRTTDLLADYFHYSRAVVERLQAVFSDRYRQDFVEQLKASKQGTPAIVGKVLHHWDAIREECDSGEVSISAAADKVRALKKASLNPPKPKKEKAPKPAKQPAARKFPVQFRTVNGEDGFHPLDTFDVGSVTLQVGITKPDGVNDVLALKVGQWMATFDQKVVEHLVE